MELSHVTPAVRQLAFPLGHVHFVRLPDGYALIDTDMPGSAPAILDALSRLGGRARDLRQIVLTHSHIDHMGSAADLAEATGARVLAGAVDAPFILGTAPEPPPVHTAPERVLQERIMAGFPEDGFPPLRHVPVDAELHDGDTLDGWGEPVHVLHVPGHTPGSIALHLPSSGVCCSRATPSPPRRAGRSSARSMWTGSRRSPPSGGRRRWTWKRCASRTANRC